MGEGREVKLEVAEFDKICRSCLDKTIHLVPLTIKDNLKMFEECTTVQEKHNDKMPNQICKQCLIELTTAYNFRQKCNTSYTILCDAILNADSKEWYQNELYDRDDLSDYLLDARDDESSENETKDSLNKILDTHHNEPTKNTSNCDQTLKTRLSLNSHDEAEHDVKKEEFIDNRQKSLAELLIRKYNVYGLTCTICNKDLSNRFSMLRHMETHDENRTFKYHCSLCKKGFYASENLKKHEQRHMGKTKFQCDECPKRFYVLSALGVHCKSRHKAEPIHCSKCTQKFYHKLQLEQHEKVHEEIIYDCKICGKVFPKRESLTKHKVTHSDDRIHMCTLCDQSFKRKSELTAHHRRRHEGNQKREICYKCGKLVLHLTNHLDTHNKSGEYKCPHCSKIYTSNLLLHGHIKYKHDNSGDKLSCNICNKALSSRLSLKSHMIKVHTDIRKSDCPICGKTYRSKGAVNVHVESVHKNERPYGCETCGKAFHTKQVLEQHTRTHTGEKPFGCDVCGKSFVTKTVLKTHMRVHYK